MSEPYQSQVFLEEQFRGLAKKLESKIAQKISDHDISEHDLSVDLGSPSLVAKFISNVIEGCGDLIEAQKIVQNKAESTDRYVEFLAELDKLTSTVRGTISRKKELEIAGKLQADKRFADLPIANDLMYFTRLKNLDEAMHHLMNQRSMQSAAKQVFSQAGLGIASGNGPSENDWNGLRNAMSEKISKGVCGCTLLYSYWLDEGGLQFGIERIADRVENGIISTTEALKMLHVEESSPIVETISSFIISWQRGELFDVDARRKQYQAQYGFPLHAARAWGSITTGDPRSRFPAAFHRFLYEASRYYDSQRDLLKRPALEGVQSAIGQLLDTLREGNENMRKKRTGQIRGQSEYCKRLLGGSVNNTLLADEWAKYLTGRPGITLADDAKSWQVKCDAVASAYGWNRPRIKEYTALAEKGETILVATRIGGAEAASNEDIAKAFVELLKVHVLGYVNAFKVVGGVDLGRNLISVPPAVIMAKKVRPPMIPPLKRHWAAIAPVQKRSGAA